MTNPLPSKAAGTTLTARQVADLVGGRMDGDAGVELSGIAPIQQADPGSLGLLADRRYLKFLSDTGAGTLLVSDELSGEVEGHPSRVVVEDAHAALAGRAASEQAGERVLEVDVHLLHSLPGPDAERRGAAGVLDVELQDLVLELPRPQLAPQLFAGTKE